MHRYTTEASVLTALVTFVLLLLTRRLLTFVNDDLRLRCPLLELHRPIRDRCMWNNNEERAKILFDLYQVSKQSNCLNRLSETHLVREDAI